MSPRLSILQGDALARLKELPGDSVHCCVTSPPYFGLRDYRVAGQLGLEPTLDAYLERLVGVFEEVRRVLHPSGTAWVNMGDSYSSDDKWGGSSGGKHVTELHGQSNIGRGKRRTGLKPKDRMMVPFRLALAMQARGWWLRDVIVWHKPAPMPESVTDRCTQSWEPVFLFSKRERYFFDIEAVREKTGSEMTWEEYRDKLGHSWSLGGIEMYAGANKRDGGQSHPNGRNPRNVWPIGPEPFTDSVPGPDGKPVSHFAAFPSALPRRCILAGTSAKGVCPQCGEPWTRVLEREKGEPESFNGSRFDIGKTAVSQEDCSTGERTIAVRTLGWEPGCDCGHGTLVPATVLDPFLGTGTTAAVALELGRHAIGIELNEAYVKLAQRRCATVTPGLALA